MKRIQILPEKVVNQIAAGEVVERPASVVKELVENSLDSGATRIEVEFNEAGIGLIKVADDGEGMSREDAAVAVARHSTSKIRDVSDLESLSSFGFRGEALASIASVSRFEMTTRPGSEAAATLLSIQGGSKPRIVDSARPKGTTVSVAGLFYNTPARRKFLKKNATETERALRVVITYALAFPHVGFTMRSDGRELFHATPEDFQNRLSSVFGRETAGQMMMTERHEGSLTLRGALSLPGVHRPTRDSMLFFVNQRWVLNPSLGHALLAGYQTLLPGKRYPIAVLFLTVPPDEVDVNVHPTKREVKFENDRVVYDAVVRVVRQSLIERSADPPPTTAWSEPPVSTAPVLMEKGNGWTREPDLRALKDPGPYDAARRVNAESSHSPFQGPTHARRLDPEMKLTHFVQMFNTFIVFQSESELFIADQHTVHERLNYEKLMEGLRRKSLEIQPLLVPATVELDARGANAVLAGLEALAELGVEVAPFGGPTFVIKTVPADVAGKDPARLLKDLADELAAEEGPKDGKNRLDRIRERALTFLACRSSVMAGDVLNEEQMRRLIERMREARLPFTCPHGRPTILSIPLSDLYRKFERHG